MSIAAPRPTPTIVAASWMWAAVSPTSMTAAASARRRSPKAEQLVESIPGPAPRKRRRPFLCLISRGDESRVRSMEQAIRFLTADDGVKLAYATSGSGPALLKTANWLNHLEYDWQSPVWNHWFTLLSRHHTLYRYDQR